MLIEIRNQLNELVGEPHKSMILNALHNDSETLKINGESIEIIRVFTTPFLKKIYVEITNAF